MQDPVELETRFSVALVRFLRHFNLLELNLGLCIAQHDAASRSNATNLDLANSSMDQKLRSMKKIALNSDLEVPDDIQSQLVEWIKDAQKARGTRNTYAHGHWELLPLSDDAPIRLHAPPWKQESLGLRIPIYMQVDDLIAMANETESLVREFLAMRSSFGW